MFRFEFNKRDIRKIVKACDKLKEVVHKSAETIPRQWAFDFTRRFRSAIMSSKYQSQHPKLKAKYLKYKIRHSPYGELTWKFNGILMSEVSFWKEGRNTVWCSGIRKGKKGSFGQYIGAYAYWLEFGRPKQKERPIMQPEFSEFIMNEAHKPMVALQAKINSVWKN